MAGQEGGLCSVFVEGDDADDADDATENIDGDGLRDDDDGLRDDDVDEDAPRRRRDVGQYNPASLPDSSKHAGSG